MPLSRAIKASSLQPPPHQRTGFDRTAGWFVFRRPGVTAPSASIRVRSFVACSRVPEPDNVCLKVATHGLNLFVPRDGVTESIALGTRYSGRFVLPLGGWGRVAAPHHGAAGDRSIAVPSFSICGGQSQLLVRLVHERREAQRHGLAVRHLYIDRSSAASVYGTCKWRRQHRSKLSCRRTTSLQELSVRSTPCRRVAGLRCIQGSSVSVRVRKTFSFVAVEGMAWCSVLLHRAAVTTSDGHTSERQFGSHLKQHCVIHE